ncbi:hypothetical protein PoB_005131200 [Plakobranchus ocellatus]|uniref:Uncharacterized protein n=1 Tax=Plakobranchus ocellatus TaxID=259542 RepID=A0AAV4BZN6_9GAST|nr:hypothetical protein PoB_005131200 [Plakobranchus ocellatus]
MDAALFVAVYLLSVLAGSQGLDLTLYHDAVTSSGDRSTCGVLKCVETYLNVEGGITASREIAKVSIFKKALGSSTKVQEIGPGKLLASLTPEQTSLSREVDGVKADGSLSSGRAVLLLELPKHEDCFAEYTCEVRLKDAEGKEVTSITKLLHLPQERGNTANDGDLTQSILLQLLQSQMSLITKSIQVLEDKMTSLESPHMRLQDRMLSLEREVQDKFNVLKNESLTQTYLNQIFQTMQQLSMSVEVLKDKTEPSESAAGNLQIRVMALERDLHYKLAFLENKIAEKKVETKEPITNPNLEEFRLMFNRIEDKLENYVSVKVREINSDVYLERRNTTQLSAEELKNYLEEIMASPFQKLESLNALHDIMTALATA